MRYPAFFDQAPAIMMRDPLAALLGAAENGLIEYHHLDAVRLAGSRGRSPAGCDQAAGVRRSCHTLPDCRASCSCASSRQVSCSADAYQRRMPDNCNRR